MVIICSGENVAVLAPSFTLVSCLIGSQLIDGYGMQLKVQELVAEGHTVAARHIETGTFSKPAFGQRPTGKSYQLVAMEFFEIEQGKIKRRWGARDSASQLRQLGVTGG